jgi:hypothetical protein
MTKKTTIIRFSFLVIISILIWTINTSNNAGQANFTNCANCHTTASSKTTVDSIVLTEALTGSVATKYVPGRLYNIAIYGRNKNALNRFGFQVKNNKGTFSDPTSNAKTTPSLWQQNRTINSSTGSSFFLSAKWTAPVSGSGNANFDAYLNAVNGDTTNQGDEASPIFNYTIPEDTSTNGDSVSVKIKITFGVNPGTPGQKFIFRAFPFNQGSNPKYQWKINSTNVGTNSDTFGSTTLTNGVFVQCIVTSSIAGARNNPAPSNQILMSIKGGGASTHSPLSPDDVIIQTISAKGVFRIETENLIVKRFRILNIQGQEINRQNWTISDQILDLQALPTGVYFLVMDINGQEIIKKLSKN